MTVKVHACACSRFNRWWLFATAVFIMGNWLGGMAVYSQGTPTQGIAIPPCGSPGQVVEIENCATVFNDNDANSANNRACAVIMVSRTGGPGAP